MQVDVQRFLRAHSFMRTEAPPEPWTPDVDEEGLTRLVGEMIAATLSGGSCVAGLTLSVANVVVGDDGDPDATMPVGSFVSVSVSGAGHWHAERTWRPTDGSRPEPFVTSDLDAAAARAGAVFAYTRNGEGTRTVVVWFRRGA